MTNSQKVNQIIVSEKAIVDSIALVDLLTMISIDDDTQIEILRNEKAIDELVHYEPVNSLN